MDRIDEHIQALAGSIGARGSTTPEEAQAADYVFEQLQSMGFDPVLERFRSARSAWWPAAAFWGCMLVAGILFQIGGLLLTTLGLGLGLIALGSILLELSFRPNLLRRLLPKRRSQNVWARIEPSGECQQHVALVAHLDTHRTPLAFSSDAWVRTFEKLVPIGMGFAVLLILLMACSLLFPSAVFHWAALLPMAAALGMLALMLQADFTPYSPGANDNASGVAVALSIASHLSQAPLSTTAVWVILTGCEEVGSYGADDFLKRHRAELGDGIWVTVDNVGSRGAPVVLSQEAFLTTARSDRELLRITREIGAQHSELRAREVRMKGAYTDGAIGAKYGLRVLTFESHTTDGTLSDWHRPSDTIENVSIECTQTTRRLVQQLISKVDASVSAEGSQL